VATRWVLVRSLCAVSAVAAVTACGSSQASERGDPAVWYVAGDQGLRPSSTTFRVTVTRTGCSSGQQGTPLAPATRRTTRSRSRSGSTRTSRVGPAKAQPASATSCVWENRSGSAPWSTAAVSRSVACPAPSSVCRTGCASGGATGSCESWGHLR